MRRPSGSGPWFAAGVLLAAILMPAATIAATLLVTIEGGSGNVASVDGAHQLLTVENDPKSTFQGGYQVLFPGFCTVIKGGDRARAMIVRQLRLVTFASPSFDRNQGAVMFPNSTCSGTPVLIEFPDRVGAVTETFEPGLPSRPVRASRCAPWARATSQRRRPAATSSPRRRSPDRLRQ